MSSLGEAFPIELERCRELLKEYESIGLFGDVGSVATKRAIETAEQAQASGEVVEMERAYRMMENCR